MTEAQKKRRDELAHEHYSRYSIGSIFLRTQLSDSFIAGYDAAAKDAEVLVQVLEKIKKFSGPNPGGLFIGLFLQKQDLIIQEALTVWREGKTSATTCSHGTPLSVMCHRCQEEKAYEGT